MAESGDLKSQFNRFATKGTDKAKEATSKDITRWCTDANVLTKKACTSNNLDIAFSKVKTKGKP